MKWMKTASNYVPDYKIFNFSVLLILKMIILSGFSGFLMAFYYWTTGQIH